MGMASAVFTPSYPRRRWHRCLIANLGWWHRTLAGSQVHQHSIF